MTIEKSTARLYGVLLIMGIITGVFTSVPTIESSDYLNKLASITTDIRLAALFQAIMAIVYTGIAVLLFPLIAQDNQRKALAYLVFRGIGAAFLFVGVVSLLLFQPLSRQMAQAVGATNHLYELVGSLLRHGRDWLNHIGMILPWSIGGVLLYHSFWRTRIIPRWLSLWGLLSSGATILATLLYLMDLLAIVTPAYFVLTIPTAIFEVTLAMYLFFGGFKRPMIQEKTEKNIQLEELV